MKPNVIVALLVGLVIGFAVGKVATTPGQSSRPDTPTVAASPSPPSPSPTPSSEADLPIKSSDFPAETFAGLSDAQKYAAMKVLNENTCDCGCPNDTFAECAKKDPHCPVAPAKMKQAITLAKTGKSAAEIQRELFGNSAPRPPSQPSKPGSAAAPVQKIDIPADSPVRGPKTAKVTIMEWSDFQCPFCERATASVKKIEQAYGKDVRLVFRHQPLPMHEHARLAAEASMAAHEQGKFWEYHDRLFANQRALDRPSLERYAADVGLDVAKLKAALDSGRFRSKVDSDARDASAIGVNGTPTFFINGRQLVGAQPFEKFKEIIDDEITKADKLLASGTKPEELYAKLLEQAAPATPRQHEGPKVTKIVVGVAPVKGPKNAPVTIIEFSDFQCPFCKNVVPTLEALEKQYGNKVKVAFKNQPLPFHANARLAAAASLAANAQGKFWEYHDKLFAHQEALDRASLDKYAAELGMDMAKFKSALDSKKFDAQITADATEATWAGAEGTPTFFINGRRLVGAQPIDAFKTIIDEELKKATELKKTAKK